VRRRSERAIYLDSSALVKLVVEERESVPLRSALDASKARVSCTLARVEVVRAVRAAAPRAVRAAWEVLDSVELVQLDDELLDLAAELEAPLRSLDAIHIAAALELGDELESLVTYDARMSRAAEALGLPVTSPS
jgi:predicted nucleic acid-binding protein